MLPLVVGSRKTFCSLRKASVRHKGGCWAVGPDVDLTISLVCFFFGHAFTLLKYDRARGILNRGIASKRLLEEVVDGVVCVIHSFPLYFGLH